MNARYLTLIALMLNCGWPQLVVSQPVDIKTAQTPWTRTPQQWTLPAPPSAQEQASVKKSILQLLKNRKELAVNDPAAEIHHLLNLARGTNDHPVARFVLLRMANDLAMKSGDFLLELEIISEFAQHYRIDALQMKVDALTASVDGQQDEEALAKNKLISALGLIEVALLADRTELAVVLLTLACELAAYCDNQTLVEEVALWLDVAYEWTPYAEVARYASLRILQDPADTDAQLAVGSYLSFIKGDWFKGLPMLARGSDNTLAALAEADLQTNSDERGGITVADGWHQLAASYKGLAQRRMILHADELYRRAYPAVTGLTRLKLEQKMISRPLFVYDSSDPPSDNWIEEHLSFRGGHGREGSGSWANLSIEGSRAILVANRAGFIETLEQFPPLDVEHSQIEIQLSSDLLMGTALEFCGQRMYFGNEGGIHLEGGWVPNVIYPIRDNQFYHFLIDISPEGISFTINGVFLGTMKTDSVKRGGIVLRGWEGHVRCKRLVVWALPGGMKGRIPLQ